MASRRTGRYGCRRPSSTRACPRTSARLSLLHRLLGGRVDAVGGQGGRSLTMRTIRAVGACLVVAGMPAALGPVAGFAACPGKNGRIAVEGDTRPGIWTVRPNGDDRMLVTGKNGLPFNPQWSPNGRWIAFTQFGSLWKIRADGSQKSRLAKGVASDIGTNVSWSPDSRMLVFNRKDDLWRVRADGTNAKQLTNTADAETAPAWSPNGGRIA